MELLARVDGIRYSAGSDHRSRDESDIPVQSHKGLLLDIHMCIIDRLHKVLLILRSSFYGPEYRIRGSSVG